MRRKWPLKILWLLGLIGLAYGSYSLEKFISQNAEETFTVMYLIWFNNLMPFLFGLYISLITIKTWNYKFNKVNL